MAAPSTLKDLILSTTTFKEAVQTGMAEARANMMDFFGKQNQFLTVTKKGTRVSPSPSSETKVEPIGEGWEQI
ncbi:g5383 [Coccomyxa elongata]